MKTVVMVFWDYDTQWGAERSRSPGGAKHWGPLEFPNTDRVLEIHDEYRVPACFAVVGSAALPGQRPYHDPAQIRRIHEAGHEIASHSHRHEWLPGLGPAALRETLLSSKDALEQCIGAPVRSFVPPYNQPYDYIRSGSISISERREAGRERTDLRKLCETLSEVGYAFCRVAYRPWHQRTMEGILRRDLHRLTQPELIGGILCFRLNGLGGFDHRSIDFLRHSAGSTGAALFFGHPHSLHAGNSQDEKFLAPFLQELARLRQQRLIEVVLPRDVLTHSRPRWLAR